MVKNFNFLSKGRQKRHRRSSSYQEYKFGYKSLLNLRNHEHTILWTKFNYYLLINSIVIVFLSTLFSNVGKTEWTGNETINNLMGEITNSLITQHPIQHIYPIYFILIVIAFIGFFISFLFSRILTGSNFWITHWENKLCELEPVAMKDGNNKYSKLKIFREHPSSVMKDKSIKNSGKRNEYISQGYTSTRQAIIWLSIFITAIWLISLIIFLYFCYGNIIALSFIVGLSVIMILIYYPKLKLKLKNYNKKDHHDCI